MTFNKSISFAKGIKSVHINAILFGLRGRGQYYVGFVGKLIYCEEEYTATEHKFSDNTVILIFLKGVFSEFCHSVFFTLWFCPVVVVLPHVETSLVIVLRYGC